MDCQTFDSSLLDALYDELDSDASRAMDEHAAGCEPCASRFARLTQTRALVSPALEATPAEGFEARILAAAEAAIDSTPAEGRASAGRGARIVSPPPAEDEASPLADRAEPPSRAERGGIVAFLSRPQFAMAATFVLVLGAVALLLNSRVPGEAAPATAARAPAAEGAAQEPEPAPLVAASAAPPSTAIAHATAAPSPVAAAAPQAGPASEKTGGLEAPKAKASAVASRGSGDPAFDAAKALFDANRHAEALPRFEALAPSNPLAELYAARCIEHMQGCGAAIARYDSAARRNAGNENGSRAALEAARCANGSGQASAARARYKALANDSHVADEARAELDALEAPHAAAKAAKPVVPQATATAAPPKAAPTAPAEAPALR